MSLPTFQLKCGTKGNAVPTLLLKCGTQANAVPTMLRACQTIPPDCYLVTISLDACGTPLTYNGIVCNDPAGPPDVVLYFTMNGELFSIYVVGDLKGAGNANFYLYTWPGTVFFINTDNTGPNGVTSRTFTFPGNAENSCHPYGVGNVSGTITLEWAP